MTMISIEKGNLMPALPTLTTQHRAEFPDGYATVLKLIENAAAAPRHTHPDLEVAYILEGDPILRVDGRPDQGLKSGDWFEVPAECRAAWKLSVTNQRVRSPTTSSKRTSRQSRGCGASGWRNWTRGPRTAANLADWARSQFKSTPPVFAPKAAEALTFRSASSQLTGHWWRR
jgi:hypothetical protein